MNRTDLNKRLTQIHQEQEPTRGTTAGAGKATSAASAALVVRTSQEAGLVAYEPMRPDASAGVPTPGLIGRALMGVQRIRDDIQREKAVRGAQLVVLGHQIEAVQRESAAYWRAKSAELTEVMNTYLQEHLLKLESSRMENRVKALELAAAIITARLESIDAANYPDVVKENLLSAAYRQYCLACERIQEEGLVEKYAPSK